MKTRVRLRAGQFISKLLRETNTEQRPTLVTFGALFSLRSAFTSKELAMLTTRFKIPERVTQLTLQ